MDHDEAVKDHAARLAALKAKWGPGSWQNEPDREEFRVHGLPALVVRSPGGHLCGYVGVPPGHPWHGKDMSGLWDLPGGGPEVHGGVTYGAACVGAICHVPKPGEPDAVWWIGFDCAHLGDARPGDAAPLKEIGHSIGGEFGESYKTIEYVRDEIARLAEQALAANR